MTAPSDPKFDLLVYAGAGDGQAVEPLLGQARRLVLIDADRDRIEALNARFRERANIEIVEAALGRGAGPSRFQRYNFSKANSFRDLEKLADLYPGLEAGSQTEIHKVDAAELILSFITPTDQSVALIIDVNGDEGDVLDSLAAAGGAGAIGRVTVHCGATALFDGALTAQTASERLEQLGFSDVETLGAGHFRRVRGAREDEYASTASSFAELAQERGRLRADLAHATGRVEALEAELQTLQASQEQERGSNVAEINRLNVQVREFEGRNRELEERLGAARSENATLSEALETARSDAESLKASIEEARRDAVEGRRAAEAEAESLRERLHAAERERDAAREREQQAARSYQADLQAAERDRDAALEREKQAASAHSAEIEALRERLAAVERERDAASEREERAARSCQSDLDGVRADLQAAQRDRDAALEREKQATREREALDAELARAREEASGAREDLAVATRLQSMAQSDLRSLQEKYRDLLTEKERLDDLLARLSSRLTEASHYLEFLNEEAPELEARAAQDAPGPDDEPARARSPRARTASKGKKAASRPRSSRGGERS